MRHGRSSPARRCSTSSSRSRTGSRPAAGAAGDGALAARRHVARQGGFDDYADWLDGLVLMGGSDMWPGHYGEEPLKPQWMGDRVRDEYETALARAFVAKRKPVFGVCRGSAGAQRRIRRLAAAGHQHTEAASRWRTAAPTGTTSTSTRSSWCPARGWRSCTPAPSRFTVNSVHHQGINRLADDFIVEARVPRRRRDRSHPLARPRLRGRGAMAPRVPQAGRTRRDRRRADPAGLSRRRTGCARPSRHERRTAAPEALAPRLRGAPRRARQRAKGAA